MARGTVRPVRIEVAPGAVIALLLMVGGPWLLVRLWSRARPRLTAPLVQWLRGLASHALADAAGEAALLFSVPVFEFVA